MPTLCARTSKFVRAGAGRVSTREVGVGTVSGSWSLVHRRAVRHCLLDVCVGAVGKAHATKVKVAASEAPAQADVEREVRGVAVRRQIDILAELVANGEAVLFYAFLEGDPARIDEGGERPNQLRELA